MARFARLGCAFTAAAALTACGGGAPPALPLGGPVPSGPSLAPAKSAWPIVGARFSYSGSVHETISGPSPSQQTLRVSQTIRTRAAQRDHLPVTDYSGSEVDRGDGKPVTTSFDIYASEVASKLRRGDDVRIVESDLDFAQSSAGTRYGGGTGNGVIDQVPEVPQARWQNDARRTFSLVGAGENVTDAYAADGTYAETAEYGGGVAAYLDTYGDGSAVYQWPYQGGSRNSTISFSPPRHDRIQVVFTNVVGFPQSQLFHVGAWFRVPPVLASDSFVDQGTARVPAACKTGSTYGGSATQLTESATRLDVAFGEYETLARTLWVKAPYGLVCLQSRDEVKTYYNYATLEFSRTPLIDDILETTLGLETASLPGGAQSVALPLDVHVAAAGTALRRQRARAMLEALRHLGRGKR